MAVPKDIHQYLQALGRKGGKKRWAQVRPAERSRIMRQVALAKAQHGCNTDVIQTKTNA